MKIMDPVGRANSRLGLTSFPKLDTRGIKVKLMSRESLLEAR